MLCFFLTTSYNHILLLFSPQSFLLGSWCLSALVDFLLAQAFQYLFEYEVEELPAGL